MLSEANHLTHEGWITLETKSSSSPYVRSLAPLGMTVAKSKAKDDERRRYCRPVVRFFGVGVAAGCVSSRGSAPSNNVALSTELPEKQSGNSRVTPFGYGTMKDSAIIRSFKPMVQLG